MARLLRPEQGNAMNGYASEFWSRRVSERGTVMPEKTTHILDGYKVIDFSQVLAGPTVTRLMAEMGAEVIKIELPPGGDRARHLPYLRDGRSGYFVQQNRGKKSVCIDVKNPVGYSTVR